MSVVIAAEVQQDVASVDERSPCSREAQLDRGFDCFRTSGSQYHSPVNGMSVLLALTVQVNGAVKKIGSSTVICTSSVFSSTTL